MQQIVNDQLLQERYQTALEAAGVGIWDNDLLRQVIHFSGDCNKLYDLEDYETITLPLLISKIHPDDRERVQNKLSRTFDFALQEPYDNVYRIINNINGDTIRWIRAKGRAYFNEQGMPYRFIGTAIDITRQKMEEEKVRTILESLPQIAWTADEAGAINYVTHQWQVFTGQKTSDAIKLGWPSVLHPDDLEGFTACWKASVTNGTPFTCNARYRNAQGNYRWHLTRGLPVKNTNGTISMWTGTSTDIHEQKTIEENLAIKVAENNKALESIKLDRQTYDLFMQAPVGICILKGHDLLVELANDNILKIWGKSADVIGLPLIEALPEIKGMGFTDLLQHVFHTGETSYANESFALLLRDGREEIVYFNFVYQPFYDADGTITGVLAIANEVTEQVLARKKVEESEQRFRNLIAQATVATAIYIGPEMKIQFANDAMLRLWGKNASVVGKDLRAALPELEGQPFHQLLQDVYNTGVTYKAEEGKADLFVNGMLQSFYFNFTYKAMRNAQGEIYGILNMAIDVTDQVLAKRLLQESEQKFKILAESTPQKVWAANNDGEINYVNHQMLEYTGLDFEENKNWQAFVHAEDYPLFLQESKRAQAVKEGYEVELRLKKFDDTYRWHLLRAVPEEDKHGNISMWVGTCTDMHDQKKQAELLEEKVKERTMELEQFAYAASHDMQEPLRKIQTFSNFIEQSEAEKLSDKGRNYLTKINLSAARMKSIIDSLLNYSNQSKSEDQFVPTDLNEIVENVKTDLELLLNQKGAVIKYDNLPVITAIPAQINQLFYNLINNSLKFSKSDVPPEIIISARILPIESKENDLAAEEGASYLQLTFADNGIGFDQKYAHRIFNLFQRLNDKYSYEGTGIGLSLCKKVVQNHGGQITAESALGEGATFYVTLPYKM